MIFIENKNKSKKTLDKLYPDAEVIDVTSKGDMPFLRLSPFYPHDNIPIPFTQNHFAKCVEGIWQGLKVFESDDVDISKFEIEDMKGIKRTVRKFGKPLGHRKGIFGSELLDYLAARKQIYLPAYAWVLQNMTNNEIDMLVSKAKVNDLVLLDYATNSDIENIKKPLSHAALVKKFIDKKYPEIAETRFSKPLETKKTLRKRKQTTSTDDKKTKRNKRKKKVSKPNDGQLTMNFG